MLVDNLFKILKLYFKSLRFQNMAQYYEIKNIESLK